jgi:hypothetical protein
MLFCVSGQVSGAMAIKLQMDTNKTFNKELASAYVMTKRFELKDMQPWLYQQIVPFGQKQKVTPLEAEDIIEQFQEGQPSAEDIAKIKAAMQL